MILRCLATGMVVLALLANSSCTQTPQILAYNNADEGLVVVLKTKQVAMGPSDLVQIEAMNSYFVLLMGGQRRFCYWMPEIPPAYWKFTFLGYAEIHVQIEADGLIYLIKPDVSLPAADLSGQPAGFPLMRSMGSDQEACYPS